MKTSAIKRACGALQSVGADLEWVRRELEGIEMTLYLVSDGLEATPGQDLRVMALLDVVARVHELARCAAEAESVALSAVKQTERPRSSHVAAPVLRLVPKADEPTPGER